MRLGRSNLAHASLSLALVVPLAAQENGSPEGIASSDRQASSPVLLEAGPEVQVANEADITLGTVREHVLRAEDGTIAHAVVDTAVRTVLVPFERFEWERKVDGRGRWILGATAAELAELPRFEHETWIERRAEDAAAVEAGAARVGKDTVLGAELRGAEVHAQDGPSPFGEVRGLVVDPRSSRVSFLLVGTGVDDDPVAVPWAAIAHRPESDTSDRPSLQVAKSGVDLIDAPRIELDALSDLEDPELRGEIESFYGITLPSRQTDLRQSN